MTTFLYLKNLENWKKGKENWKKKRRKNKTNFTGTVKGNYLTEGSQDQFGLSRA